MTPDYQTLADGCDGDSKGLADALGDDFEVVYENYDAQGYGHHSAKRDLPPFNDEKDKQMGQYWKVVNLDKREYIHPHRLGCGLKLVEQIRSHPGTGPALLILCTAMPAARGGGDFRDDDDVARRTIGRWAGDRICLVGDYCETDDLSNYDLTKIKFGDEKGEYDDLEDFSDGDVVFTDISDDVSHVLARELGGKFIDGGFRFVKG